MSFAQGPVNNTKFQIDYVYTGGVNESVEMEDSMTFIAIDKNGDSMKSRIKSDHDQFGLNNIEYKHYVRGDNFSSEIFFKKHFVR